MIKPSDPAGQKLIKLLEEEFGLPKGGLYSLVMTMKFNEPMTFELGFYARAREDGDGGEIS